MIPIPKFRLGTIFLLFFCYAVGLTIAHDAFGAVEPTIVVAMLIGLSQEIRLLWLWTPPPPPPRASFTFARRFAILWRCIVVSVIFEQFVVQFIRTASPPSSDAVAEVFADFSLVSALLPSAFQLCVLIVLCNSIERWRPKTVSIATSQRSTRWLALLAAPLATITLLNATMTLYLTHRAISGIEAGQPAKFRRPGAYTTPVDENLFSFWVGSIAVLSLIVGAIVTVRFIRRRCFEFASLWNLVAVIPLITTPAIFSIWFFASKFRELSPDMFGNGFEARRMDWLLAGALVATSAAIAAFKIGSSRIFCEPPIINVLKSP